MSQNAQKKLNHPTLELIVQPQDYFRECIVESMHRQKVDAAPETQFYLVNLLQQFMVADRLFPETDSGARKDEPLVFMLKEAIESPSESLKRALFKQVGDIALYLGGYFQDSLNRKWVDVDYYVELGGMAYVHVAERVDTQSKKIVYVELAEKFARFVDVFADMSDRMHLKSEKDLLRLYELWQRTGSERIRRSLQEAGIVPVIESKKDPKKNLQ